MLRLIPTHVPPLATLVADLTNPTAAELARALGVSERTVWRWLADGGPQAARLALYWLTPWGWSAHAAEARRRLQDWQALAEARRVQLDALQARFDRLASLGDFGSANAPDYGAQARFGAASPSVVLPHMRTAHLAPLRAASMAASSSANEHTPGSISHGINPSSGSSPSSCISPEPPPPQAIRNAPTASSSATS